MLMPGTTKGIALDGLGKYGEAVKSYERATELNPKDADAWCSKGAALDELTKDDEAIKVMKRPSGSILTMPYACWPAKHVR
jgi:tetratricopeptide (TPR) repeat protein